VVGNRIIVYSIKNLVGAVPFVALRLVAIWASKVQIMPKKGHFGEEGLWLSMLNVLVGNIANSALTIAAQTKKHLL
jgi:hypothetical protein